MKSRIAAAVMVALSVATHSESRLVAGPDIPGQTAQNTEINATTGNPGQNQGAVAGSINAPLPTYDRSYTAGQTSASVEWTTPAPAAGVNVHSQLRYDYHYSPFTDYGGQGCTPVERLIVSIHRD